MITWHKYTACICENMSNWATLSLQMDLSIRGLIESLKKSEKMGLKLRDLRSRRILKGSPSVKCW